LLQDTGKKLEKKNPEEKDPTLSWAYHNGLSSFLNCIVQGRQFELLLFICETSVRYGRCSTALHPKHFRSFHSSTIGFAHWEKREIRRYRRQLKDKNLIHYIYDSNHSGASVDYIVNVGGIGLLMRKIFNISNWPERDGGWRAFEDVLLSYEYQVKEYGEVEMDKEIKEKMKAGFAQSANAMKRKKMKRAENDLQHNWIRPFMVDCCEEYDMKYLDEGFKQRDIGSARNFLKYCNATNQEPRDILREVCRWWGYFQTVLVNDKGKEIHLTATVSFRQFFQYRTEIQSWLEVNRQRLEGKANKPKMRIVESKFLGE